MAAAGLLLNFHYENEGMRYEIRREVNTWREVRDSMHIALAGAGCGIFSLGYSPMARMGEMSPVAMFIDENVWRWNGAYKPT